MVIQIEIIQALIVVGVVVSVMSTLVVAYSRVLLNMVDRRAAERHKSIATTLDQNSQRLTDMERDFLRWQLTVAENYVRHEDYVRNQSIIEVKLDSISSRLTETQITGARRGN